MAVHVVMPWRAGDPTRHRARRWVIERWTLTYPEWQLRIAEQRNGEGGWCKALPVMSEISGIPDDDVVIVADADVWGGWPVEAVARVEDGLATWAVPHRQVRRLSEDATRMVLAGHPWTAFCRGDALAEKLRVGVPGGGMVIARASTFKSIPMDPRFTGWGQEDHSWGIALSTLCGEAWRPKNIAPLVHLWHPPADRINRFWGSRRSQQPYSRYLEAEGDVASMLALIGEIDPTWAPTPETAA